VLGLSLGLLSTQVAAVGPLPGAAPRPEPVAAKRATVQVAPASLEALAALEGATLASPTTGARTTASPTTGARATASPTTGARTTGRRPSPELTRARSGGAIPAQPVPNSLGVVGVVWDEGAVVDSDVIQIRVHDNGTWGPWQEMEHDGDHAPDVDGAGGSEGRGARQATSPHVVTGDRTQVRLLRATAAAPRGVEVVIVDPGTSGADATVGRTPAGSASADAGRPAILTRRDWGADESKRGDGPFHGQAHIAFVHHTDGSNTYSSAQVPGIIRGIYDFHVNGQGWSDIGYNFLVDRFGRIWEGRYGGVDRAVIGAHTMNYNSWSFGVSAIGNFSSTTPPTAMLDAIERVIAWKFSVHGNPATGTVYARDKYFNRVSGHRDGYSTACPGQRLYDLLPAIRRDVTTRMGTMRRVMLRRSLDYGSTPDLLAYDGTWSPASMAGRPSLLVGASPQPVAAGRAIGAGWNALDDIVVTEDFTGDGHADILARDPGANTVRVYRGDGRGGFAGMSVEGGGWHVMNQLIASGDRDGDDRADLLALRNDGALLFYSGDGRGWVRSGRVIGTGWGALRSVASVGDLTGDGSPDLLAIRRSDNKLVMYAGQPDGSVRSATVVSGGWGSVESVIGAGDLDGDGSAGDVLARETSGRMRTYYASSGRALARYNFWGGGWGSLSHVTSGADWDGNGTPDVVARRTSDGDLLLYPGTGHRDFDAAPVSITMDVTGMNLVRIIGDVDADGRTDAIGRSADGDLHYFRGQASGFAPPVKFGGGWQIFDMIEALGDFSRDGVPDVLARTTDGQLRMYTLNRDFTWKWSVELGLGWNVMRSVTGAGSVNTDYNGDVIALRASDGAVLNYRGSGPGTLNDAVVVLTGQTDLARLLGVGDHNGDGKNDLLATDRQGNTWLYLGNGNGFSSTRQPVSSSAMGTAVLG
jgi:hypothetical protein